MYLCILEIDPLSNIRFENIFSYSPILWVAFLLCGQFSDVQILNIFMKSSLSIFFSFVTCAFDVISKKIIIKSNVMKLLSYVFF